MPNTERSPAWPYVALYCRGLTLVTLTALNVHQIAHGTFSGAFLCGWAISYVWYGNARSASLDGRRLARLVYATGAATGTVLGMWIGQWSLL